jgi:hypothetical protein
MPEPESLRASVALAAYAEPLLDGRRVIVFGDSSSNLAEELLVRGARLVHVYDPDPTRVAEAATRNTSRNISIAPLSETGLAAREGAFDVGIVEDLPLTGPAHSVLKRLRRALGPRGVALVAAPNAEARARLLSRGSVVDGALDYYQLYDAVAAEFHNVRMLGQTPFVGFAVVDFAAQETPEPSLDTSLVPGGAEEPEAFIALGSTHPLRLDEFSVIQLPITSVLRSRDGSASADELTRSREAEQRASELAANLEAELFQLRTELRTLKGRHPDAGELGALRQELSQRDRWIAELEARSGVADARADEAETELERLREQMEREQAEAGAPVAELEKQLARAQQEIGELGSRLAAREAELRRRDEAPPGPDDLSELEQQLRARGAAVRRLETDLAVAERVGRELLAELGRVNDAGAEREADLWAARWTIQELQGGAGTGGVDSELGRARAELQRQAALLAQAVRDRDSRDN